MQKIAILTCNYNQPQLSIDTVKSLLKIKHPNFEYKVFLLDNGSSNDSYQQFIDKFADNPYVSIHQTKSNLGFVGGNNYLLKLILNQKFDYYLLINNDVQVDKNFLNNLLVFSDTNPEISIFTPKIYFAPGHEYQKNYLSSDIGKVIWFVGGKIDWNNIYCSHIGIDQVDHGQFDTPIINPDFLTGCCLLIRSKVIKKIGLLDEKYYLYLEDADFCVRAKNARFNIAYVPTSKIWHYISGTSSIGGDLHHYFLTRNRLLFGFKYARLKTKFALFRDSIRILITSPSSWQRRGVIDYYLGIFGKGSWK